MHKISGKNVLNDNMKCRIFGKSIRDLQDHVNEKKWRILDESLRALDYA
jgi:hypothetical protein